MYLNAYKKYQVKYSCLCKFLDNDGTLKEIRKEKFFNVGGNGLTKIIANNLNDINFLECNIDENTITIINFDKDTGETEFLQYEISELKLKEN